jgi:glycosyltransferase involved in cell wall biosynthesis
VASLDRKRALGISDAAAMPGAGNSGIPTVLVYRHAILPYSETFIAEQVRSLSTWRAVLVGEQRLAQLALDGLEVRWIWSERPSILERVGNRFAGRGRFLFSPMLEALRALHPALLHAHFGPDGVGSWALAKVLGVPLVVTLHGYDITIYKEVWERKPARRHARRYPRDLAVLARNNRVWFIAVSQAIREQALSRGIPSERLVFCPIGIDLTQFRGGPVAILERQLRVLFVGRLVEKKGCRYLLEAFAGVARSVPGAELVVVGEGPERAELEQLARRLEIRVAFKCTLPPAEVHEELRAARVLCLPSVTAVNGDAEGLGMVLLEAQAAGVPVVTSARGGATEAMVHGETGFAFAERDVPALEVALRRILVDDALCARFSAAGPRFIAERYDIRKCTNALSDLYTEIVAVSRAASRN